jgi:hypothetical protein
MSAATTTQMKKPRRITARVRKLLRDVKQLR